MYTVPFVLCRTKPNRHCLNTDHTRHSIRNSTKMSNVFTFLCVSFILLPIHEVALWTQCTYIVHCQQIWNLFVFSSKQERKLHQRLAIFIGLSSCNVNSKLCMRILQWCNIPYFRQFVNLLYAVPDLPIGSIGWSIGASKFRVCRPRCIIFLTLLWTFTLLRS